MDELERRRQLVINPQKVLNELELPKEENSQSHKHQQSSQLSPQEERLLKEQLQFDARVESALNVEVPENLADKILYQQMRDKEQQNQIKPEQKKPNKWLAPWLIAAYAISSFVLVVIGLFQFKLIHPGWIDLINSEQLTAKQVAKLDRYTPNLPVAILEHLHEDSHALDTQRAISKVDVNTLLASMGGKLTNPIGHITYLSRCIVGKNTGLHLVVDKQNRQLSVLILPAETLAAEKVFGDDFFKGVVFKSDKGVIAIISNEKPSIDALDVAPVLVKQSKPQNIAIDDILLIRQRVEKNLRWII